MLHVENNILGGQGRADQPAREADRQHGLGAVARPAHTSNEQGFGSAFIFADLDTVAFLDAEKLLYEEFSGVEQDKKRLLIGKKKTRQLVQIYCNKFS